MMEFGRLLFEMRKEKSLTQANLADVLGVSCKAISRWEKGETYPEYSTLLLISDFFNITTDNLIIGKKVFIVKPTMTEMIEIENKAMNNEEILLSTMGIVILLIGSLFAFLFEFVFVLPVKINLSLLCIGISYSLGCLFIMMAWLGHTLRKYNNFLEENKNICKSRIMMILSTFLILFSLNILAFISFDKYFHLIFGIVLAYSISIFIYSLQIWYRDVILPIKKKAYDMHQINQVNIIFFVNISLIVILNLVFFMISVIFADINIIWSIFPVGMFLCILLTATLKFVFAMRKKEKKMKKEKSLEKNS